MNANNATQKLYLQVLKRCNCKDNVVFAELNQQKITKAIPTQMLFSILTVRQLV